MGSRSWRATPVFGLDMHHATAVLDTADWLLAIPAGKLTATPPTTAGQVNVCIGSALSSTELEVDVELPILL